MIFKETILKGTYIINLEKFEDKRGFFARSFCKKEMKKQGIKSNFVQTNISFNKQKGTFRGMHFQEYPMEEAKLIRCTKGSIYDVLVDLRTDSPTYLQSIGVNLTEDNYTMLYVPEMIAHGFITLKENTEVFYLMSEFYSPECSRGYRWNDPSFNISLPINISVISEKDQSYPRFDK